MKRCQRLVIFDKETGAFESCAEEASKTLIVGIYTQDNIELNFVVELCSFHAIASAEAVRE